jgi:hypothetical protein
MGASLLLPIPEGHMQPSYIAKLMVEHNVTCMGGIVPTLVSRAILGFYFRVLFFPLCRCHCLYVGFSFFLSITF